MQCAIVYSIYTIYDTTNLKIVVSRIKIAEPDILTHFEEYPIKVFKLTEIQELIDINRRVWRLAKSTTGAQFLNYFIKRGKIKEIIAEGTYGTYKRYIFGEASPLQTALSFKGSSFLTHYTAVYLHGLTAQIPKTIYVNSEQTPKPKPKEPLNQENINRAFARPPRVTTNETTFEGKKVVFISGKYTGSLGVTTVIFEGEELLTTDTERTLLDIAVRPVYSGGVNEVLKAYRNAGKNFSLNRLLSYLKKIDYTYPYHQVIGYYLERSGYPKNITELFKEMGLEFDFYLAHGIKKKKYIEDWRLFVPEGF